MKGRNQKINKAGLPRRLRNTMTDAERALWQRLRSLQIGGYKFRRQHPFRDHVLDFVCMEKHLVIEIDGGQHLESTADEIRDQRLNEAGFTVLRFWNNQVLNEIDAMLEVIWRAVAVAPHPHPGPPPFDQAQDRLEGEGNLTGNSAPC